MNVFIKPDGSLIVPVRLEGEGGVIADAMKMVAPGEPEHDRWTAWLRDTGTVPEPWEGEADGP